MDYPKFKALLKGALTFIPYFSGLTQRRSGGTTSARYCYSVWLRHCVKMHEYGVTWPSRSVAELGPGDSLGIGLCALLTGAEKYYAFDVKPYQSTQLNRQMLGELARLIASRAPIPDDKEFPDIMPKLTNYSFPSSCLSDDLLLRSMHPSRINQIEASLVDPGSPEGMICYKCPWYSEAGPESGTIDLVFSQAVMEHVEHVEETYRHLQRWLRPKGHMCHTIDFRSHKRSKYWYGHWVMSPLVWHIIRGRRTYLLNRLPIGEHLRLMQSCSFRITTLETKDDVLAPVERLTWQFKKLTEQDRRTAIAYVLAEKTHLSVE